REPEIEVRIHLDPLDLPGFDSLFEVAELDQLVLRGEGSKQEDVDKEESEKARNDVPEREMKLLVLERQEGFLPLEPSIVVLRLSPGTRVFRIRFHAGYLQDSIVSASMSSL